MKLIRDKMLDVEWTCEELKAYVRSAIDEAEYRDLLDRKLLEESGELITALDKVNILEEIADIYEILLCVGALYGFGVAAIEQMADEKRSVRGSFTKGLVIDI